MSSTNIHNKKNDDALLYAHQFLEEAKEEEMEATALEDSSAMPPQNAKKEKYVGSGKEVPFVDEAKVEYRDQKKKAAFVSPEDDKDLSDVFVPALSSTAASPRGAMAAPSHTPGTPGAFLVRGQDFIPQQDSLILEDHGQLEHETLFKAVLVDDTKIASAFVVDLQAERKAQNRRQGRNTLMFILAIGILAAVIAIPIQLTRPKPSASRTLAPSDNPSASPSQSAIGFLAGQSLDNEAALSTPGSSQERALTWLKQSTLNNSPRDYTFLQFYALAVFNYATGDLLRLSSKSWFPNNGTDSEYGFCDWDYITCKNGINITHLKPSESQLNGSLLPEIGLLTSLMYVDLSMNAFNGTIPTEIGLLTSLNYLDLSVNTFTGTFPTEIGLLTSLTHLSLSFNIFTGTLPTEIGLLTSLTNLNWSDNSFNGTLPTEIGLLTSLTTLSLSQNNFTGTLAREFGLLTSLTALDLFFNIFNGTLPTEIALFTNLTFLDLSFNTFTGTIPTEIGLLTSLTTLSLYSNIFTGTLATEFGMLRRLSILELYSNNFTGTLSSEIGRLSLLVVLDLSFNTFTGTVPTEIGNFSTLLLLALRNNSFTGTIPADFDKFTS